MLLSCWDVIGVYSRSVVSPECIYCPLKPSRFSAIQFGSSVVRCRGPSCHVCQLIRTDCCSRGWNKWNNPGFCRAHAGGYLCTPYTCCSVLMPASLVSPPSVLPFRTVVLLYCLAAATGSHALILGFVLFRGFDRLVHVRSSMYPTATLPDTAAPLSRLYTVAYRGMNSWV